MSLPSPILGFLKLSADGPPVDPFGGQTFTHGGPGQANPRQGFYQNPNMGAGTGSYLGLAGQAVGAITGIPEIAGMTVPLAQLAQAMGIQLPRELMETKLFGYGGSPAEVEAWKQLQMGVMQGSSRNAGVAVKGLLKKLVSSSTGGSVTSFLKDKMGMDVSGGNVTELIDKMPDQVAGMMVSTIAQFPEAKPYIQAFLPNYIYDPSPIIHQALADAKSDPKLAAHLAERYYSELTRAQESGLFNSERAGYEGKPIPAQLNAEAFRYAKQKIGPNATIQQAAQLAKAADHVVSQGLAPADDFNSALSFVEGMGIKNILANPQLAAQRSKEIRSQLEQSGRSSQEALGIIEEGKRKGIPPTTALNALISGGNVKRVMRDSPDALADAYALAASDTVGAGADRSDSIKLLSAARAARVPGVEEAIASKNWGALQHIVNSARGNSNLRRLALYAPSEPVVQAIGENYGDWVRNVELPNYINRRAGYLKGVTPEQASRIAAGDFTGISDWRVARDLSAKGPYKGRLGGIIMAGMKTPSGTNFGLDPSAGKWDDKAKEWIAPKLPTQPEMPTVPASAT